METVLVTGGAGFIGSALTKRILQSLEYQVIVMDDLSSGNYSNVQNLIKHKRFKFIKGDVNSYKEISEVILSRSIDYVFHYAATVGVEFTQKHPTKVLRDISGIQHVCSLSKNSSVKRIFFSSSSEVYGEPVEIPQNEDTTPLNSKIPYALVKNTGESFLRSFYQEYGLEYTIFRFFNTYGAKQTTNFVINKFIKQALMGKEIMIYGDGQQSRTFCYIDDNVNACYKIFDKGLYKNETVNIGHDTPITIQKLAQLIQKLTKSKAVIKHLPALKEGDMRRRLPDIQKMNLIHAAPKIKLAEGIQRILDSSNLSHNC